MRKTTLLFVLICSACTQVLFAQGWQWAAGGTGGSEGYGVAVDPWGNIFAAGFNNPPGGSAKFGSVTLSGFGVNAVIVVKYDVSGNVLWASNTTDSFARPIGIVAGPTGSLFLLGYYTGPKITIGSVVLNNPNPNVNAAELFLVKYRPSGSVAWAINVCNGNPVGAIAARGSDAYITGSFTGPAITLGTNTFVNSDPTGTTSDIFMAKVDSLGRFVFAKAAGSVGYDYAGGIAVAPSGAIYIAGTCGPPAIAFGSTTVTNPDTSLFVARYDASGNFVWAKLQAGVGKIGSFVGGVAADSSDNVFITGAYRARAIFGAEILQRDTTSDIFLAKYDATGNISWVKQITGAGNLGAYGVIVDNCSNVWITGAMGVLGHHGSDYVVIDGYTLNAPDDSRDPMFISGWTNNGTYLTSSALPTGGDDQSGIAADGVGNIYVGGDSWGGPYHIAGNTLDDPDHAYENIFVAKYTFSAVPETTTINTYLCISDTLVLNAPPGYSWYQWENGSTDGSRTVRYPGTYRLYCTGGCNKGVLTELFTVEHGKLDSAYTETDATTCLHAHATLQAPAGYRAYLWEDGKTGLKDTINGPGTYWVICYGTCTTRTVFDTFKVTSNNIDLAFSLGNDTILCAPLLLQEHISGVSSLWQDGTTDSTMLADHTGKYVVTISEQGCFNSDSISVYFPNLSQNLQDTFNCKEWPVAFILNANVPTGGKALWSTGSTQQSIEVIAPGQYWVTVTDYGCTGTDTMTLNSENCTCIAIVPSAFTPNGDGKNDFLHPLIDPICHLADYIFSVYNRWGQLVYSTRHPTGRWDGRFRNTDAQQGVYMYYVQYRIGTSSYKHLIKGDVTLIR